MLFLYVREHFKQHTALFITKTTFNKLLFFNISIQTDISHVNSNTYMFKFCLLIKGNYDLVNDPIIEGR